jgi:hypothetical protein
MIMKTPSPLLLLLLLFLFTCISCKQSSSPSLSPSVGNNLTEPITPEPNPAPIPRESTNENKADKVVLAVEVNEDAVLCGNANFDLMATINGAVKKYAGLKYSSADTADCSGIFHRVLFDIKEVCTEVSLPPFASRSSRALALWYFEEERIQLVRNPEEDGKLIEKGTVMFYGRPGQKYDFKTLTIDDLARDGGIFHVATVVDVKKDDTGKVISYDIFHALNERKRAQVNTVLAKNPNYPDRPAYSYFTEYWVACAKILGPKK